MQSLQEIISLIERAVKPDANNLLTAGGIISDNFDSEIDHLRNLVNNSNQWLNEYTKNLVAQTSITTLKIKYTSASGYFIEVPLSQKAKIPENFIHKTTLVNALRFTTPELREFEGKIMNAESLLYEREYEIFKNISSQILENFSQMKEYSHKIAQIDYVSNLSYIAYENDYVKPEISS